MTSNIRSSPLTRAGLYVITIGISVVAASSVYEELAARRLIPESFLLEFAGFFIFWLVLDAVVGRSLTVGGLSARIFDRPNFLRRCCTLTASVALTAILFQVGSFAAELASLPPSGTPLIAR